MVPIALDPSRLRLGLVARGAAGLRRLGLLNAGGATALAVFCDEPESELGRATPPRQRHLPRAEEIAALHALWIVGLSRAEAEPLAACARSRGVAVNVEDASDLCDFHNVAEIRRGDLLLTVSTGGRSPGLAAAVRGSLERQFGWEWASRAQLAAEQRRQWRKDGLSTAEIGARLDGFARTQGWLP